MPDRILVVGAGPVGLTLAIELARRGVRPRVIDRLAAPLPYCRAIGVTPRTLEVYERMGVLDAMLDASLPLAGLRVFLPGAPPRDVVPDLDDLPYGPVAIRQPATEAILTARLGSLGVEIERGTKLLSLEQDAEGVAVVLDRGGTGEEARFDRVVGCDGAHSAVRHALGIAFEGEPLPGEFMLGEVTLDPPLPRGFAGRAIRPKEDAAPEIFIAVPLPETGRYRVSGFAPDRGDGGSDHGIQAERPGPELALLQDLADRLMPDKVTLRDLGWSSYFRISMRLAARYAEGRVFLAGDAAHIHPPTGGQGMNTGIQDAFNLGWKLALAVSGRAVDGLLASYDAERRPVGADVVARTVAASVAMGRERTPPHRLEDTQMLVGYRESPIIRDDGPAPEHGPGEGPPAAGDRAADATGLRRFGVHRGMRLFELLGPEFTLLVAIGADPVDACGAADALGRRFGDLLRIVAIAPAGAAASERPAPFGITVAADADGRFADRYRPRPETAWLIRPDGYVAWRGPLSVTAIEAAMARMVAA